MTRTIPLKEKPRLIPQGKFWTCYGMGPRPFWPWKDWVPVMGIGLTPKGAYDDWLYTLEIIKKRPPFNRHLTKA